MSQFPSANVMDSVTPAGQAAASGIAENLNRQADRAVQAGAVNAEFTMRQAELKAKQELAKAQLEADQAAQERQIGAEQDQYTQYQDFLAKQQQSQQDYMTQERVAAEQHSMTVMEQQRGYEEEDIETMQDHELQIRSLALQASLADRAAREPFLAQMSELVKRNHTVQAKLAAANSSLEQANVRMTGVGTKLKQSLDDYATVYVETTQRVSQSVEDSMHNWFRGVVSDDRRMKKLLYEDALVSASGTVWDPVQKKHVARAASQGGKDPAMVAANLAEEVVANAMSGALRDMGLGKVGTGPVGEIAKSLMLAASSQQRGDEEALNAHLEKVKTLAADLATQTNNTFHSGHLRTLLGGVSQMGEGMADWLEGKPAADIALGDDERKKIAKAGSDVTARLAGVYKELGRLDLMFAAAVPPSQDATPAALQLALTLHEQITTASDPTTVPTDTLKAVGGGLPVTAELIAQLGVGANARQSWLQAREAAKAAETEAAGVESELFLVGEKISADGSREADEKELQEIEARRSKRKKKKG